MIFVGSCSRKVTARCTPRPSQAQPTTGSLGLPRSATPFACVTRFSFKIIFQELFVRMGKTEKVVCLSFSPVKRAVRSSSVSPPLPPPLPSVSVSLFFLPFARGLVAP